MRPSKRWPLSDTSDGRLLKLVEAAKTHMLAKVEHPFRVIKPQFGFSKTRLQDMTKNRCKVNVLAADQPVHSLPLISGEKLKMRGLFLLGSDQDTNQGKNRTITRVVGNLRLEM